MSVSEEQETNGDVVLTRDDLAMVRTKMAMDRTLLSCVRTALACCASGVGLLKFWDWTYVELFAWPLVAVGVGFLLYGIATFVRANKTYKLLRSPELVEVETLSRRGGR